MVLSVVILDNGEPSVIRLTYENLWREIKDMADTELLVADDWFAPLRHIKSNYVCFVEADCLVSSGYFKSQLGLFQKNKYFRKLAMLSSRTGVNNWANCFYGYKLNEDWSEPEPIEGTDISIKDRWVEPSRIKKSTGVYPVQIGYVPGSIISCTMLRRALEDKELQSLAQKDVDLVRLSAVLSFAFWRQGDGNRVHINPNATYVTTESYVNDIAKFDPKPGDLVAAFERESI